MESSIRRAYQRVWEYYLEYLWVFPGVVEVHLDDTIIRVWVNPGDVDKIQLPTILTHQGIAVPVELCVKSLPPPQIDVTTNADISPKS